MSNLKVTLISQLGLMGDAKFGYVGKWLDALILVREDPKHQPPQLIVTIGLKNMLSSVPPLPKALAIAEKKELLVHQRWPDQIRLEIPDPDSIDPGYFLKALEEYKMALSQADCLPDIKCSECMNRQKLDVVARNDRALLICPDCVHRLPPKSIGSGTVVMMVEAKRSLFGGSSDALEGLSLGWGKEKVNWKWVALLPLTILLSASVYGVGWYICLRFLNNFDRLPVKFAAIIFGLLVLAPTCLPLIYNLRKARITGLARPIFVNWMFVAALSLLGETVQVVCVLGSSDEINLLTVLISPITLPLYWQSLGLFVGVLKVTMLLIAIVLCTVFAGRSARTSRKS